MLEAIGVSNLRQLAFASSVMQWPILFLRLKLLPFGHPSAPTIVLAQASDAFIGLGFCLGPGL